MVKKLIRWLFISGLFLAVLSMSSVLALRWINPPYSMLMLERKISAWRNDQPYHITMSWRDWQTLPDHLKLSVIAAEDQHFATHYGFDVAAIKAAYQHNKTADTLRGASTISQQVAKNMYLWSSRSWPRKALEAWFTFWIELMWSKERILEVYLNIAEWGEGIFGAEAAAQRYFKLNTPYLSAQQSALLAASLPSPLTRNPAKPTAQMLNSARWIQQQVLQLGGSHYLNQMKAAKSNNELENLDSWWTRFKRNFETGARFHDERHNQ